MQWRTFKAALGRLQTTLIYELRQMLYSSGFATLAFISKDIGDFFYFLFREEKNNTGN